MLRQVVYIITTRTKIKSDYDTVLFKMGTMFEHIHSFCKCTVHYVRHLRVSGM
jgi:hypothetical protein